MFSVFFSASCFLILLVFAFRSVTLAVLHRILAHGGENWRQIRLVDGSGGHRTWLEAEVSYMESSLDLTT